MNCPVSRVVGNFAFSRRSSHRASCCCQLAPFAPLQSLRYADGIMATRDELKLLIDQLPEGRLEPVMQMLSHHVNLQIPDPEIEARNDEYRERLRVLRNARGNSIWTAFLQLLGRKSISPPDPSILRRSEYRADESTGIFRRQNKTLLLPGGFQRR